MINAENVVLKHADNLQYKLIEVEDMFRGTINQTSVYPREVVKAALKQNASAVMFAHNHPSGLLGESAADVVITKTLKDALALVDVKVLDHFIVSLGGAISFAEKGLI